MATEIEVYRNGGWDPIRYSEFSIEIPTSEIGVAPSASVTATARESINANQDIRIVIDGAARFEGVTESSGTIRGRGQLELDAVHAAEALFEERVSVDLSSPSATDVLEAGLSNANRGDNFTLDWSGSDVALSGGYEGDNRQLSQLFRDMCDRCGRLWWVDPAGSTIHVEPRGGRGTWQSLDARADGIRVKSFNEGSVKTVRNDVTVNATAGENVTGSATDSASISEYGRRSEEINISYAETQSEAEAYAEELIIPEPLSQGEIAVPQRAGNIVQPLVNYTVDLTDAAKGIDAADLTIEKQTIEQGRATLKIGEGSAVSMANVNRNAKSNSDENPPGAVMPTERIGELAITETRIDDSAVTTPKVRANTITANEVDVIDLDTNQITVGNAEANIEFDVIEREDLVDIIELIPNSRLLANIGSEDYPIGNTYSRNIDAINIRPIDGDNTGFVGRSFEAFQEIHAYSFQDASSGQDLQSQIDDLEARVSDLESSQSG